MEETNPVNEETDNDPPSVRNRPPPIDVVQSMSEMIMNMNMNTPTMNVASLEDRVTDQSFHEQPKFKQVSSKDFINSLSVQEVSEELVENKITCGICLEQLSLGERVIELPCKDKHYFHIKKEECPGIYPWLKRNNTCPLCRHEFPSEEVKIEEGTEPPTPRPRHRHRPMIITPRILQSMFNSVMEEEEERMLQEVLYNSLHK